MFRFFTRMFWSLYQNVLVIIGEICLKSPNLGQNALFMRFLVRTVWFLLCW
jgi:hypothetical protein